MDRPFGSCNTADGRVAGRGGTMHKSTVSTAGNKAALIDSKTVQFQERSDHDLQAASEGLMHELFQGWRDEDVDDSGMEVKGGGEITCCLLAQAEWQNPGHIWFHVLC